MPPRKALSIATRTPKRQVPAATSSLKQSSAGIYDDLLAEATSETDFHSHDDRPLKRRKPTPRVKPKVQQPADVSNSKGKERVPAQSPAAHSIHTQSEVDTGFDDDSNDSDLAFEDVDLEANSIIDIDSSDEELEGVHVSLGPGIEGSGASTSRNRTAPRLEKEQRVLGHKAHFAALIGHCMIVNARCNDQKVQRALKPLLASTTRAYLRPSKEHTQFQQDRTFTMGLERACETFKDAFNVNAQGLTRAYWQSEKDLDKDAFIDRAEFRAAAVRRAGSQDTGNQLFCALLRACGVNARIVCSLQVLPLTNTVSMPQTPTKSHKPRVFAIAPDTPIDGPVNSPSSIKERAVASARSRIGQPAFKPVAATSPSTKKSRSYHKLSYPVFWVEVLNVAYQKWIPVDPICTQTFKKVSKLEPPLTYPLNQLVYAIAFSKNGSAKDVTRRYAKAYNAKTRRMRLDAGSEADRSFYRKVMSFFKKQSTSDADIIEETELTQRIAQEGLPSNIQDFKGHPIYALERQLKRHEVIFPRREAGKVNAGTAAKPKMEPIFRREDVHVCRGADQWYRYGRIVKDGEQALKLVPARARLRDSDDEAEQAETALYTLRQTELYIPRPVVRGKIPRNAFGNLDIYVPSMVPKGGAHIRHPLAKAAAELLQIDAVDAVTGFKFARRKGTAVIEGAVVPEQYFDAMQAVIEGLLWQEIDDRSRARSALAMRMWKRFLQGLKIAERVASYATEPMVDAKSTVDMTNSTAWYADDEVPLHTAGQYTLDELLDMAKAAKKKTTPTRKRRQPDSDEEQTDDEASDDPNDTLDATTDADELGGGFIPGGPTKVEDGNSMEVGGGFIPDDPDVGDSGGGFVPDDPDIGEPGGGFVPDESGNEETDEGSTVDLWNGTKSGGGFIVDDADTAETHGVQHDLVRRPSADEVSSVHELPAVSSPEPSDRSIRSMGLQAEQAAKRADLADGSDRNSLLSHDPEDDDAEPDWMESE